MLNASTCSGPRAPFARCALLAASCTPFLALADGFLEDGKATLLVRNFYMNRDFRDGTGRSKSEEWAQGFLLDYRSGYTTGTVGVGLDALGKLGIKLDSSPNRSGTGLLPVQRDGRAEDDYARFDPTAKLRVSGTELRIGALVPKLPTVQPNFGRLFPQVFQGGLLTSSEVEGLTLNLGRLDKVSQRNEAGSSELALFNRNKRFAAAAQADHFSLGGLDYRLVPGWTGSYHYGELEDVYDQHVVGLKGQTRIGSDSLETDLRLAISNDAGAGRGGRIDNRAFSGLVTYRLHSGHALGLGYQRMNGGSAYPYLDGTDPYLVNFGQYNDFAEAGETSWQARYDYDFAALGLPGLTLMTRYFRGRDAEPTGGGSGREWERDTDIKYAFQDGPLKGLGLVWRNAVYRSAFSRDVDENRLYLSYSLPL
ncbi:OprD family porin [Pseudomonas sp. Q1-7]|uniref:OprD family porin n=1 Tax=Pseudomonas sp. Q1-7 TaxID=3020843 RepID=UPI0023013524|nr:OprD family porin [Pseudomonas sp. Q1-7]